MEKAGVSIVAVLVFALAMSVCATDHIVGGNKGWNPGVNYIEWAKTQTFIVGDWISFRYQKMQHNVLQVNKSGYENCTTDSKVGNWSSGKDFVELNQSKMYYFIDGMWGCQNGMKVAVFVEKPAPPPHSHSLSGNSTANSSPRRLQPVAFTLSGMLMLFSAFIGI